MEKGMELKEIQVPQKKLLNATEAALYLGVSRSLFYKWLKQGRIRPSALDKRRYSLEYLNGLISGL
jgi:excisionase family DNA binding protein